MPATATVNQGAKNFSMTTVSANTRGAEGEWLFWEPLLLGLHPVRDKTDVVGHPPEQPDLVLSRFLNFRRFVVVNQ